MLYCLVIYLVSLTYQIYHLATLRLGNKFDWSMTLLELLDNITRLVIFYFFKKGNKDCINNIFQVAQTDWINQFG